MPEIEDEHKEMTRKLGEGDHNGLWALSYG